MGCAYSIAPPRAFVKSFSGICGKLLSSCGKVPKDGTALTDRNSNADRPSNSSEGRSARRAAAPAASPPRTRGRARAAGGVVTPTAPQCGKQGSARARSGEENAAQLAATPPAAPPKAPDGAGRRATGLQNQQFSAIRRRRGNGAPAESASAPKFRGRAPPPNYRKFCFCIIAPRRTERRALPCLPALCKP